MSNKPSDSETPKSEFDVSPISNISKTPNFANRADEVMCRIPSERNMLGSPALYDKNELSTRTKRRQTTDF